MEGNEELFNFQGQGNIKVKGRDDIEVNVDFFLIARYNSKIDISMISNNLFDSNLKFLKEAVDNQLTKCSFIGTLSNSKKIEIPEFYINTFNLSMKQGQSPKTTIVITPFSEIYIWDSSFDSYKDLLEEKADIKVGLLNFVFGGNKYTKYADGSMSRDLFSVKIDNVDIDFRQIRDYSAIEKILRKERAIILTSEIEISDIKYNELQELISNLLWLLSYSQKTLISKYYTKLFLQNEEKLLILHHDKKYPYSNSSFVDTTHLRDDDIEQFIQETYHAFSSNKKEMKLDNIIDIICQAELARVLESRYLLLSSALELSIEVIRQSNNLAIENDTDVIDNMVKSIKNYLTANKISIEDYHIKNICLKLAFKTLKQKIDSVLKHLKFEHSQAEVKRIKDNRNKIVHEVRFVDYNQPLKDYELIKILVDKILLRILGYSGKVINYSNKHKIEKIL